MVLNKDDSDAAAQAQAQESRNEGVQIITSHLSSHLDQNPDSDFVSWIATLHPENADVRIDPRFFVPNNPWWSVYEAAKSAASTVVVDGVPADSITREEENARQDSKSTDNQDGGCFCNPIGFVVGTVLTFVSVISTFTIEVTALLVYFLAAVSFNVAAPCNPPSNPLAGIIFSVFMLLHWIFSMVDSILLLVSVLVSEILGAVAGILGCLCGGCRGAKEWHQTVRKSSHALRVSFRKPFTTPSRQLFCSAGSTAPDDNNRGSARNLPRGNTDTRINNNNKPTVVAIPRDDNDTSCYSEESPNGPTIAVLVDTIGGETPLTNPVYQPPPPAYKYINTN